MTHITRKWLAWLCTAALLCGCAAGLELIGASAEAAEDADEWTVVENMVLEADVDGELNESKLISLQLPKGHPNSHFELHVIATLDAEAASLLNEGTSIELDNDPRCDTSEIAFTCNAWVAGKNEVTFDFANGRNGSAASWTGPAFSPDAEIRFFRFFSTAKATVPARATLEKVWITYADSYLNAGMDFFKDTSDTYLQMEKPLTALPVTWEAAVMLQPETTDTGLVRTLFSNAGAAGEDSVYEIAFVNGCPRFTCGGTVLTADTDLRTGKWVRVTAVCDAAKGKLFLYADGKEIASAALSSVKTGAPETAHCIGADGTGKKRFNGKVADMRLWSVVRTPAEIAAAAPRGEVAASAAGLTALWELHNNITHILETVYDASGTLCAYYHGSRRDQWFDYGDPAEEVGEDYYTMVVLPDLQNVTLSKTVKQWEDISDWVAANIEKEHIVNVSCMGDNTWGNDVATWKVVQKGFDKFAYSVPWNNLTGNHDYPNGFTYRNSANYNTYFGADYINRTAAGSTYMGKMEDKTPSNPDFPSGTENSYYCFNVAGVNWMILQLEYRPRLSTIVWAESIVRQFPNYNIIIATHGYLGDGGEYGARKMNYVEDEITAENVPSVESALHDRVVVPYSNVKFVWCGHASNPTGDHALLTRNEKRADGSVVYQMMINAQDLDTDDTTAYNYYNDRSVGMIALFRFSADGRKVAVDWYCPTDGMSYDPHANGNDPATTFGASNKNRSHFVLPLDLIHTGEDDLKAAAVHMEAGDTLALEVDVPDNREAYAAAHDLDAADLHCGVTVKVSGASVSLTDGTPVTVDGVAMRRYRVDGIAASAVGQQMTVLPRLLDKDGKVVYQGTVTGFDLTASCFDLYENGTAPELARTMLNYATAVQQFKGSAGKAPNRLLPEEARQVGSHALSNVYRVTDDEGVGFYAVSASLDADAALRFVLNYTDLKNLSLRVTDEDGKLIADKPLDPADNYFGLPVAEWGGIPFSELARPLNFTVCQKGEPVGPTLTYSVESYLTALMRSDSGTPEVRALINALGEFAVAAEKAGALERVAPVGSTKDVEFTLLSFGDMITLGDVDYDGKVDSTDARLILQYYAKKIGSSAINLSAADVDGNGTVDSTDARLILQYYAKKIADFPAA